MYILFLPRSAVPPSFLGTSFAALTGLDEHTTAGSVMVAAGSKAEASPQESNADLLFFGTPSLSFFGEVPLDLVVTPAECGDSLTGCSTASSSAAATSQSQDSGATVRPGGSKSSGSASSARSIPELYEERGASSLREFGLRELHAATSDFSRLLKIGEGGFGSVYKGVVRLPGGPAGGTVVAIKRLNTSGHQVLHFCFHG